MNLKPANKPAKTTRKIFTKKALKPVAKKALEASLALVLFVMALAILPEPARGVEAVVVAPAAAPSVGERFGVAHSHLPLYDTPTLESNLNPLQSVGIGWARSVFAWTDLEPQQGTWDFSKFDNYVGMAAAHGISILGILLTSPTWANGGGAWNTPPTDMAAWGDYVRRVVTRYRDRVAAWEVWNEENIDAFWPSPSVASYLPLLVQTSTIIREVDPSAKIVMGGVAGTDPDWLRNCLTAGAGDYVDAIAYHPYPEGLTSFNYTPQEARARTVLENARSIIADCSAKPLEIWLTELGWTTSTMIPPGVDEATQGANMLRTLITYAGTDVDRVFYYKNWDDYPLAWWPDFCYGLLRNDFSPKPAYFYYQRFMEVFGQARGESDAVISYDCANPATLEAHAFAPDAGTLALAVWKTDDVADSLSLTVEDGRYLDPVVVDLETGARTPLTTGVSRDANGDVTVQGLAAGKLPVILEFKTAGPWIDGVTPERGGAGTLLSLRGGNFGSSRGACEVSVGGLAVTDYRSWSDSGIACAVPPMTAGRKLVSVTTPGGISNSATFDFSEAIETPVREPLASTWYLAEGCTAGGMETWVLVENPGAAALQVSLELLTAEGKDTPAALQGVDLPAFSRRSFRLNDYCSTFDVSTMVSASGQVVVERSTYGPGREWAHSSTGVSTLASTWYLAEGCTAGGMETWVLVENPGAAALQVSLELLTAEGKDTPAALQGVDLPAFSRRSFRLNDYCSTFDVSTMVSASGQVVVERSTYGPGREWAHSSTGVSTLASTWYLAEGCTAGGMETWVLVENPGAAALQVSLELLTAEGKDTPAALQGVDLPAFSRRSFRLNDYCSTFDVSTMVSASGQVVVERSTYGPGREWAHSSTGVSTLASTWYLAEGCTAGGMETWVLVENPGAAALQVSLELLTAEGKDTPAALQGVDLPAFSRRSFRLNDYCSTFDVSTMVSASGQVVVERSTYGPGREWAHSSTGSTAASN